MNTVLIRCRNDRGPRETNASGIYPPLGLACVAASLRAAGHEVTILDGEVLRLSPAALLRVVPAGTRILGFTSTTLSWPTVRRAAFEARKRFPKGILVIGGPHVTAFPEATMRAAPFDVGVLGDGEETMVAIADRVSAGGSPDDLPGCVRLDGDAARVNLPVRWIEDLDTLPPPALDLLPMEQYRGVLTRRPFATMVTSRGCPFRCRFCTQIYSGGKLRTRSPEAVVEDIERAIRDFGAKEIVFFDETFGVRGDEALRICELILQRGIRIRWNARTRVDVVTDELLSAMRAAGCRALHFGVESGSQRILDAMNKGITLEQARATVGLARRHGFFIHGYFMIGYPGETREETRATLRFSRQLGLDLASYTVVIPSPRTPLHDQAVREGRIARDFWEQYTLGNLPAGSDLPFFESQETTRADLKRMKRQAYVMFYARPGTMWRTLRYVASSGGAAQLAYAALLWLREELL